MHQNDVNSKKAQRMQEEETKRMEEEKNREEPKAEYPVESEQNP